jgi:hypothetical protein
VALGVGEVLDPREVGETLGTLVAWAPLVPKGATATAVGSPRAKATMEQPEPEQVTPSRIGPTTRVRVAVTAPVASAVV